MLITIQIRSYTYPIIKRLLSGLIQRNNIIFWNTLKRIALLFHVYIIVQAILSYFQYSVKYTRRYERRRFIKIIFSSCNRMIIVG